MLLLCDEHRRDEEAEGGEQHDCNERQEEQTLPTGRDEWVFVLQVADRVDVEGVVFPGRGDLEEGSQLSQTVFVGGLDPDLIGGDRADCGRVAVDAIEEVVTVGDDQRASVLWIPGGEQIERAHDLDGHVDARHAEFDVRSDVQRRFFEEVLADHDRDRRIGSGQTDAARQAGTDITIPDVPHAKFAVARLLAGESRIVWQRTCAGGVGQDSPAALLLEALNDDTVFEADIDDVVGHRCLDGVLDGVVAHRAGEIGVSGRANVDAL